MIKRALEIFTVQDNAEELSGLLDEMRSKDTTVFENAIIEVCIGGKRVQDLMFDCAVFSDISDKLILVKCNSKLTSKDVKKMLDKKGILYNLVTFIDYKRKPTENAPEIWFAKDGGAVGRACDDTIAKGVDNITYEFNASQQSSIIFRYLNSDHQTQTFTGDMFFTGAITLEDKIILIEGVSDRIIEQHQAEALDMLHKKGFALKNNHTV